MNEVDSIISLTDKERIDDNTQRIITQVNEFDRYVSNLGIAIEKKHILFNREDEVPCVFDYN